MEQKKGSPCLKKSLILMNIQQNPDKCWHIIMKSSGGYGCQVYALSKRPTKQSDPYQSDLRHPQKKNAIHLTETKSGNV